MQFFNKKKSWDFYSNFSFHTPSPPSLSLTSVHLLYLLAHSRFKNVLWVHDGNERENLSSFSEWMFILKYLFITPRRKKRLRWKLRGGGGGGWTTERVYWVLRCVYHHHMNLVIFNGAISIHTMILLLFPPPITSSSHCPGPACLVAKCDCSLNAFNSVLLHLMIIKATLSKFSSFIASTMTAASTVAIAIEWEKDHKWVFFCVCIDIVMMMWIFMSLLLFT